ncbi:PP2C family protein-serine/threonine phosphatase [Sulfidibacter corallicola]|uniref:Serine/threonine-protein phosphatase n=1 Tax=Sulfidibacter corallicola TaxID=2818388 RepID=A0A8A4TYA1_SULCO|nr:protein phosphatase 2C domain-containing protein [Sulfidibacter corallicola]QTD54221.1 serine/threonine-protein phosphatase [Sulfidibacter corallicola]
MMKVITWLVRWPNRVLQHNASLRSLSAFGATHIGRVRAVNEDCFWMDPDLGTFAVSDGLGGENAGDVASKLAIRQFQRSMADARSNDRWVWPIHWPKADFDQAPSLCSGILFCAIQDSHKALLKAVESNPAWSGMGATLIGAIVADGILHVSHVGDSRAYLWRDGDLRQLTRDHTLTQVLLDSGKLTPQQAQDHFGQNQLCFCLGSEKVAIEEVEEKIQPGDRVLLCSDGVHRMIQHDRLSEILGEPGVSPVRVVRNLIEVANDLGGKDNITAVVVFLP